MGDDCTNKSVTSTSSVTTEDNWEENEEIYIHCQYAVVRVENGWERQQQRRRCGVICRFRMVHIHWTKGRPWKISGTIAQMERSCHRATFKWIPCLPPLSESGRERERERERECINALLRFQNEGETQLQTFIELAIVLRYTHTLSVWTN